MKKRTIEYFKNNASLRDSLKEGRRRSGVGKLPIHRKQHSPNEGHLREKLLMS
jgi:hypothetical protein